MKHNVYHYHTDPLYQKRAVCFDESTCLQCQQADSAIHILSRCQHNIISGMIIECHNVASRPILKAISKGSLAGCLVHLDAGSTGSLTVWPSGNFKFRSMLVTGHYLDGFCMLVYLPETGLPQFAPMPFWILPYPSNPNRS